MTEPARTSKFRFGRKTTVGTLGGTVGASLLTFTFLLFRVAVNVIVPGTLPVGIEFMGLPLGFSSGALIAIEEFGE